MQQSVEVEIAAPLERVWDVLTGVDSHPQVFTSIVRIERRDRGPLAVGSSWAETRRVLGMDLTASAEVVDLEPHAGLVVIGEMLDVPYRSRHRLEPLPSGRTRLRHIFSSSPAGGRVTGVSFRILSRMTARSTRRSMVADLHEIRRAAEQAHGA